MEASFKTIDVASSGSSMFNGAGEVSETLSQQNKGKHISLAFIEKPYDNSGMVFVSVQNFGYVYQSYGDHDVLDAETLKDLILANS